MKKAPKCHGSTETITTDGLHSYKAAMSGLGCELKHEVGRWANKRLENSHLPFRRRERSMLRFRKLKALQKFASVHANVNNLQPGAPASRPRDLHGRRSVVLAEWQWLMS